MNAVQDSAVVPTLLVLTLSARSSVDVIHAILEMEPTVCILQETSNKNKILI